jgi:hypothetical protein
MYSRRVYDPEDVVSRIIVENCSSGGRENQLLAELFAQHLLHYLRGNEVIAPEDCANDPCFRARLLLQAMTELQMLPVSPITRLKVGHPRYVLAIVIPLTNNTSTDYCSPE